MEQIYSSLFGSNRLTRSTFPCQKCNVLNEVLKRKAFVRVTQLALHENPPDSADFWFDTHKKSVLSSFQNFLFWQRKPEPAAECTATKRRNFVLWETVPPEKLTHDFGRGTLEPWRRLETLFSIKTSICIQF